MDTKIPPQLELSGNIAENYKKFKQRLEIYLMANDFDGKPDERKVAILLNIIGEEGLEVFNNFQLGEVERKNYKIVLDKFDEYFLPQKNVIYERYNFYKRCQENNEPFEIFLKEVKTLAKGCEFLEEKDMIRDRIVLGINDSKVQEKLLSIRDLKLEKAIQICKAAEVLKEQMKEMTEVKKVEKVEKKGVKNPQKIYNQKKLQLENGKAHEKNKFQCRRCQKWHGPRECPAFGKECQKCGKLNHFKVACKVRQVQRIEAEANDEEEYLVIDSVGQTRKEIFEVRSNAWYEDLIIEGRKIKFKLDTGAEANIIPYSTFQQLRSQKLVRTKTVLEAYGGVKFKPVGVVTYKCKAKDKMIDLTFLVVDVDRVPLLGLEACVKLQFIKRIDKIQTVETRVEFIEVNKDLFTGLGKFPEKCKIIVKEDAIPVVRAPRRVPLAIKDKLNKTLQELEKKEIIKKVEGPTDWVSNLVVVEKPNGSLRICMDPSDLNKSIVREQCLLPKIEEIQATLSGKDWFTVLDMKDGFYQVELDEESSYLYDIIICGDTKESHDAALNKVLERARLNGVKFNMDKVQFRHRKVKYLGHQFSKEGMSLDDERVRAIRQLKRPNNKKEVQQVLGSFNYFRSFIPNLAEMSEPLRGLLKRDKEFSWAKAHDEAFEKIQDSLIKAPVLANFDVRKELVLQTDASSKGLGACLMQGGKPLSYFSRSLTDTEKQYAQIEKEFLAITSAVEKFKNYLYGNKFKVLTDHKPLIGLMNKNLSEIISPRLQRMRLKLVKYNLEVQYIPGKELYVADMLSRNFVQEIVEDDKDMKEVVHNVRAIINISDRMKEKFQVATESDEILKKVKGFCVKGWPKVSKTERSELLVYSNLRHDLVALENVILYKDRLVVPVSLREEMLKIGHESHNGSNRMLSRMQEALYWPCMKNDIEQYTKKCEICNKFSPAKIAEPMLKHKIVGRPFAKIGVDIAQFGIHNFVIIMDYFSKWLEIIKIKDKTAQSVIEAFKKCFATHGIPEIIVSDNMPLASYKFKNFAELWGIKLITSSPHYPKSNGQAESGVKIVKAYLRKEVDLDTALLNYRTTNIPGVGLSPAQILMGRQLRSKIPIKQNSLIKKRISNKDILGKLRNKQEKYKKAYDKRTMYQGNFRIKQQVFYRKGNVWEKAVIVKKCKEPRSYIIETQEGSRVRRNSRDLKENIGKRRSIINDEVPWEEEEIERIQNSEEGEERVPTQETGIVLDSQNRSQREKRTTRVPSRFKDYTLY
ncbi:uncharacterized protein K02A2.6-like [Ceratina calcarata]|uniref:RNA-directed DNA polymerase n=1 Tax=Ceratina calcarata TaxID=156304 RepID=A0AAJ7NF60_9HYME|nr:uncharacterized protein K02A2.6-like [Ceratina calcarata]